MAYLFNSVDDQQEQKQNIFASTQPGDQAQPSAGGDNVQKGSTATSISSAASGSGGAQASPASPAPASPGGYNPAAVSSAYKSASASIKMPTAGLSRAEGSLAAGNQTLQQKSNAYQTKAADTAKTYQLDDTTLSNAAGGSDADFQKTAQRLSSRSPGLFESFEGLGDKQPNVENVQDVGNLYREEVGPSYTAGQSRLDAALLRQNPEFLARQQSIMGQAKQLREADKKAQDEQTKTARDMLGQKYTESTDDIRRRLGGYGDEVVKTAKGMSDAETAKRAALDPAAIAEKRQQEIKNQIQQDLQRADPRSEQYRALKFLADQYDLGSFVNVDRETDWREFLDDSSAGKYNRVQGLLGNADMVQAGKGPGEAYEFDQAGAYKNMLAQLQGKRQSADRADREQMAAIQAAAQARAAGTQKSLREQYEAMAPEYQQMMRERVMGAGGPSNPGQIAIDSQDLNTSDRQMPAYQDTPVDWQTILTPDEISKMNSLQNDLGIDVAKYSNKDYGASNKTIAEQIAAWKANKRNSTVSGTNSVPNRGQIQI